MTSIIQHNQKAWDKQAEQQQPWSVPVSHDMVKQAQQGNWEVHLTPSPLPKTWLGDIRGKKILCLASAGGQQAPILAAAGAIVTVFDLSEKQLDQDRMVAERDNLILTTVQGDMRDLHCFADKSFNMIFHPISNLYVPDVTVVWREAYRVLKKQGVLLASFYNPVVFIEDRDPQYSEKGLIKPKNTIPYEEIETLTEEQKVQKLARNEAYVFGHSLSDLIGGQITAGFSIDGFYEDKQPNPRFTIDNYLSTFIATKATKHA